MELWILFVVTGLGGWIGWQGYCAWKRPRQMQALAARLGMDYMNEAVPGSLHLDQTSLGVEHDPCHVLDGVKGGARIVAFDYGVDGRSYSLSGSLRTVIAVESDKNLHEALALIPNFRLERADAWQVFFGFAMMQIEELEAQIGNIESVLKD